MSSGVSVPAPAAESPAGPEAARALGTVLLILGAVYFVSGPRTLPDADAGEFIAVAVAGGIPHPPGYPLLTVILQACAHLAGVLGLIPALTLPSTLAVLGAALLLCRTLLDRGQPAFEAAVATLAVFLSCNVWRAATTIEPFGLNLLQAASLLWACNKIATTKAAADSPLWSVIIGANFGVAVCNHHSLVTLAPLPLAVLWPERGLWLRRGAWMLASFVLGLTPLLFFLFLRNQDGWIWGDWDAFLPQLLHHLARTEYGSLSLAAGASGTWLDGPARMLGTLPRVLSIVFALCLGLGGWAVLRDRARARHDRFAIGLVLSFVLSGLCFPALFVLKDDPVANVIVDRFISLPMLLLAFPIATGLRQLPWPSPRFAFAGGAVLVAWHVAYQWPDAERASHRIFEDHVRNVFTLIERNAAMMTVSDAGFSGGLYGRYVLGRRDVVLIPSGLNYEWHLRRVGRTLGLAAPYAGKVAGKGAGEHGPQPAHPLYLLEMPASQNNDRLSVVPVGPLLRVLEAGAQMPSAREQFIHNAAIFAELKLPSPAQLQRADAWELDVLHEYRANWDLIGRRLGQSGDSAAAQKAFGYRDALTHH